VEYVLDGEPLSTNAGGQGIGRQQVVTPGRHVLAIRAVYVGRSPVFAYVEGYRFTMKGRVTFEARPGWVVRIRSTGFAHEGLSVRWEQRPAFKLEGVPRRAILSIESGPVEHEPMKGPGREVASNGGPGASGVSPEEATRRIIDEVLAEAHRRAPLEKCSLEPLYFDFADTRLRPEAEAALRRLSVCLLRRPALRVRIQGHCDARGSESFNDNLGQGRAQTVAGYLSSAGVPRSQFALETEGAAQPACPARSPECFARSRRVELIADTGAP
jgi:peptidoglycan-associated lipoprotein